MIKTRVSQSKGFREQIISQNTNQVFKKKVRELTNTRWNEDLEWEFHMKLMHMYGEIITFKSSDKELEKYFNSIKLFMIEGLYWNGVIGLKRIGQKYGLYTLGKNVKRSVDGFISSSKCKGLFSKEEEEIKAGKDGAFMQYDQYRFPIFVGLDYWKEKIMELQTYLIKDVRSALSKQIFFFNKEDLKDDTFVEKWSDINDITDGQIKLIVGKPIDKQEIKTTPSTDNIIKTINYFWNQMLNFRGFQTNVSQKESGVAVEEMNINLEQISTVMNSYINFWQKFCEDLNSSYDLDLEVEKIEFIANSKLIEEEEENEEDKNDKPE